MSHIVDIDLKLSTSNEGAVKSLIQNLEKIQKLANVSVGDEKIKQRTKEITDEVEKQYSASKRKLQLKDMEIAQIKALKAGHKESFDLIQKYISQLNTGLVLTKEQTKDLQIKLNQDKLVLSVQRNATQEMKTQERLIQSIQKAEIQAHAENKKRYQEQINASQQLQRQREQGLRVQEQIRQRELQQVINIQKAEIQAHNENKKRSQDQINAQQQLQRQRETALRSHELTRKTLQEQLQIIKQMQTQHGGKTGGAYTRLNQELMRFNTQLTQGVPLNNQQARSLDNMVAATNRTADAQQGLNQAMRTFAMYFGSRQLFSMFSAWNEELRTLDTSIYNLGVVANFSASRIENLRGEMLALAKGFPQSAKELADSADLIARTGLSFEDSLKIVQSSARLATSSGRMFA